MKLVIIGGVAAGASTAARARRLNEAAEIVINIPLNKLRTDLGKLPKDKPAFLYCKVGFRSYLAYRILKQSGFTRVATLAGGSTTFLQYHPGTAAREKEPDKP